MILCINHKTMQHFGSAYVSQFHLRYQMLVDAQYWSLSRFQGMEYDQYDTPATTYLVWQDADGVARGCARIVPTDRPYMIKDIWPDLIEGRPLPQSLSVWEATRFCVDGTLPYEQRQRIKHELVLGFLEFGLKNDVKEMVGTMPVKLWESVFIKSGWGISYLGKEKELEKDGTIIAGLMPISLEVLENVRMTTGVKSPVLVVQPETRRNALRLDELIRHTPEKRAA